MSTSRIKVEIAPPLCPNFLITKDGARYQVGGFTDSDLRRIGREWTRDLLARAREQRAAKVKEKAEAQS